MERTTAYPPEPSIQRWTTDDVPTPQRFEYFVDALSSAVVPMRVESDVPAAFSVAMTAVDLGGVSVVHQVGTAHRSFRNGRDLAQGGEHSYHLILNLTTAWTIEHRGAASLRPGDAVLTDSSYGHDLELRSPFEIVHLKFSEAWLRRWIAQPDALVGRRLARDEAWTRPLTCFVSCLSPRSILDAALPAHALSDQVGALLAMLDLHVRGEPAGASDARLQTRILDCIAQRCAERDLSAEAVAASLGLPVEALHQELLARSTTFSQALLERRIAVASRMLASRSFRGLTLDEISARAGFASSRSMTRVMRNRDDRLPPGNRRGSDKLR